MKTIVQQGPYLVPHTARGVSGIGSSNLHNEGCCDPSVTQRRKVSFSGAKALAQSHGASRDGCGRGRRPRGTVSCPLVRGGSPGVRGPHGGQPFLAWVGSPSQGQSPECQPRNRQRTFPKQPFPATLSLGTENPGQVCPQHLPSSHTTLPGQCHLGPTPPTARWEVLKGRWPGPQSHPYVSQAH